MEDQGQVRSTSTRKVKILVINPNSSTSMTKGVDRIIDDLGYSNSTQISTYTAPSGPDSINNEDDAMESAKICVESLKQSDEIINHEAFLVACYSVNPLVTMLRPILPTDMRPYTPITGIFEASISAALSLLPPPKLEGSKKVFEKFGIVTTGKYWEKVLTEGVLEFLGCEGNGSMRFKGVETTGLSAGELHTAPPELVKQRMMDATRRLVKDRDVSVICLGCAGMAGMDAMVKEACVKELGEERARYVRIVDGVKAGIAILDGMVRAK